MKKANLSQLKEEEWFSPGGKFGGYGKQISEALGCESKSMDLTKRHPFDIELSRLPAGMSICPYHSHSAQWEFYLIISGKGTVRDQEGTKEIGPGDAVIFAPDEAHQITNPGPDDLVFYTIADNPIGDTCHYPDSGKWSVRNHGKRMIVIGQEADYFVGEE